MPRKIQSQWEFGELFSAEPARKVWSVVELTSSVRRLLEKDFARIWVSGEITNLKVQASGHIYFTLKDASAQLGCVLFRGEAQADRSLLQDGRKVTLEGGLTVYEPRGQYQMRVTRIELQGEGALQAAFEKLKQKLKAEGLFDAGRKRVLPRYSRRIGVVTSPTGAAIRDVLHVIQRRNPALEVVLAPCRVQGEGAAAEIAGAIALLNEYHASLAGSGTGAGDGGLDLILVTRGGGSLEDLWAFNEEEVARAIYTSVLPVVSAVGHEVDFTISDFVADLRAATPSAAAEIITEGVVSSCEFLRAAPGRLRQLARQQLEGRKEEFRQVISGLARVHPRGFVDDRSQHLDDLVGGLGRCVRQGLRQQRTVWRTLADRIGRSRPALILKQRLEKARATAHRLNVHARLRLQDRRRNLDAAVGKLRLLGPEQVLARGYSITTHAETGGVLRDSVAPGTIIRTRLQRGEMVSTVQREKTGQ